MVDGGNSDRLTHLTAQRRLMALAHSIDLTRDERLGFAEFVLKRDVRSWSGLSTAEMLKLGDYLEGYVLVGTLLAQRANVSA